MGKARETTSQVDVALDITLLEINKFPFLKKG